MPIADEVRRFWDEDASVYDQASDHHPTDPALLAAWVATVADLLQPAPARVLDCGAGTGFLSIIAARLGHQVTALDISPGMLQRLKEKAAAAGLDIEVVEGSADEPPAPPQAPASGRSSRKRAASFDAVIERHLLWTLPDPVAALTAWRRVAPEGRLVLFEGAWASADPLGGVRRQARRLSERLQPVMSRVSPSVAGGAGAGDHAGGDHGAGDRSRHGGHHAEYPQSVREALPLGQGTTPRQLVEAVEAAGWPTPRLRRLRDVEWATTLERPVLERVIGASPRYAVIAGS